MNFKKVRSLFSNPFIPGKGHGDQSLSWQLGAQGPSITELLTPHLLRRGQCRQAIHLIHTSLGCGRKLKSPENSPPDMGKMCKLHTDSGPGGESIFFHQRYNERMLKERTLCQDCTRPFLIMMHHH